MDSASKPYDITDIPFFPYVPGWVLWAALLVAALLSNLLIRKLASRARKAPALDAYEIASAELQTSLKRLSDTTVESGNEARSIAARAALMVRRFLSMVTGMELSTLSAAELMSSADSIGEKYSSVLAELAALEDLRYNPAADKRSVAAALSRVAELLARLRDEGAQQR